MSYKVFLTKEIFKLVNFTLPLYLYVKFSIKDFNGMKWSYKLLGSVYPEKKIEDGTSELVPLMAPD